MVRISTICDVCERLRDPATPRGCTAFASGIPTPIWDGLHDHRLAYAGDNGVRFAPRRDLPRDVIAVVLSDAAGKVAPEAAAQAAPADG